MRHIVKKAETPQPEHTIIELFKVVVAERTGMNFSNAVYGFVTDFNPTPSQVRVLRELFQPVPITTMFSVEERVNASPEQLFLRQILHYYEVYGLDAPGLFQLEVSRGQIATVAFIKAVTISELTDLVHGLIYANRPIGDAVAVAGIINEYRLPYDINRIRNNELRVTVFNPATDRFTSGDDAVRYICYHATGSPMLIKSKEVIAEVQKNPVGARFLESHILPLAQVFNRHERLIMACKHQAHGLFPSLGSAGIVNRISKLSKKCHVPIHEPLAKRWIATALREMIIPPLDSISLRDKFKFLNLIEYRLLGLPYETFLIRNGKVWTEGNRSIADGTRLLEIRAEVLASVAVSLAHLRGVPILLDGHVDYGLPISRKQTLGNLPYGTRVTATGREKLSAGIYWHNGSHGSIDLDLSAIDNKGNRTGWGQYSGYARGAEIVFSGDVTSAPKGASEFMVVDPFRPNRYGLMVNIFRGPEPCEAEIVVGYPSNSSRGVDGHVWQDRTLIREKIQLQSKQSIIGFLKDNTFVVYSGQLNNSRVSRGKHPIIDKALGRLWTLGDVLNSAGISYDVAPRAGVTYAHDLRYQGFSLDKLEGLLGV